MNHFNNIAIYLEYKYSQYNAGLFNLSNFKISGL